LMLVNQIVEVIFHNIILILFWKILNM
jgi:hypothetical protein